ncbi:MAG: hypothetical protein KAV87_32835, partial [Desulfobacteraceae bacterium]|nr:hypothetical protein [Desulfobacteraceae bacterium]
FSRGKQIYADLFLAGLVLILKPDPVRRHRIFDCDLDFDFGNERGINSIEGSHPTIANRQL